MIKVLPSFGTGGVSAVLMSIPLALSGSILSWRSDDAATLRLRVGNIGVLATSSAFPTAAEMALQTVSAAQTLLLRNGGRLRPVVFRIIQTNAWRG